MSINRYNQLYNSLADDLSKTLFLDRVLFSITREWKYVYQLIEDSMPELFDSVRSIDDNRELIIYGAGVNCDTAVYACRKMGKNISLICDKNTAMHGKKYQGIDIISPDELIRLHKDACILISTTRYMNEVLLFLKQHFDEQQIIPLANEKVMERIKMQYFDECVGTRDDEVFIDGGCYDFETCEVLLSKCKPKKIYAFEPDEENYHVVMDAVKKANNCDIEVIKKGLWDESCTLHFTSMKDCSRVDGNGDCNVEVVALDQVISDQITFVKMDIEGSEMKALEGAQNLIKKYKPRLAICIYHKPEDVIDILEYIKSLVPEYKLYIRHHAINQCETVVYAVI